MAKTSNKDQAEQLQNHEVALANAINQSEISSLLTNMGYGVPMINTGNAFLLDAKSKASFSQTSYNQYRDAQRLFMSKRDAYRKLFLDHRKRIKILFRNDASKQDLLLLKGPLPVKYTTWYDRAEKFYSAVNTQDDLKNALTTIGITQEDIDQANTIATEVKAAEFEKFRLKAVSEDATVQKKAALATINIWMRDFYDMAKIALKDRPQLLEALNKVVKS